MRLIDAEKLKVEISDKLDNVCDSCTDLDCHWCFANWIDDQETVPIDVACAENATTIERLQEKNAQYIETIQELKANMSEYLTGWIPCSLGFEPEEDGLYLCTLDGELVGEDKPFVCSNDFYQGKWSDEECMIAWQPLPKPYKESE